MKNRLIYSLIFLLSLPVMALASDQAAANQLSQLLKSYKTYQADFKQVTYSSRNQISQKSSGKLMMLRPGKFRWETNNPTKQIIIANGDTLWVYDIDLQQATKQKINNKNNTNPASLLTGNVSQLLKEFDITKLPGSQNRFQLKSLNPKNSFQSVEMTFSKNRLTQINVINNLGQKSDFTFSNIRLNKTLNPKLFEFKPPKGVDVLTE